MPYNLSVPRAISVPRHVSVDITRVRIVSLQLTAEDPRAGSVSVDMLSGTGPYQSEGLRSFGLEAESVNRILLATVGTTTRLSNLLERAVFDELARLGHIPAGTVV